MLAVGSSGCILQLGQRRQFLERVDGSHALGEEHAPGLELTVLVLLQQNLARQVRNHRNVVDQLRQTRRTVSRA